MKNEYIGGRLLAELQELEVQLMHGGRQGLLSLIEACIDGGWNTGEAILAKVRQIGGPYYDFEVPQLLAIHASPLARPQLWEINDDGNYQLIGKLDATTLAFWRSAHLQPDELDQAT